MEEITTPCKFESWCGAVVAPAFALKIAKPLIRHPLTRVRRELAPQPLYHRRPAASPLKAAVLSRSVLTSMFVATPPHPKKVDDRWRGYGAVSVGHCHGKPVLARSVTAMNNMCAPFAVPRTHVEHPGCKTE